MSTSLLPTASAFESKLRPLLGDRLNAAKGGYGIDDAIPTFVAEPNSVEELAATLAAASECGAAVVAWGAGTHMSLGNPPDRYDLALRTARLGEIVEHEPADLTVAVEAGITMGRLQGLLSKHGQFLPIDASPDATVGGVLATGASGPSRHAYGLPRDWLIGCRIAHADGSVSKGGGRVVKNVAGYDMPKLCVGSLGTLGVIVEATFKVAPQPVNQETLLSTFASLGAAGDAIGAAGRLGLALRAVALVDDDADPRGAIAAFWLSGPATAVERSRRELAALTPNTESRTLSGEESTQWWGRLAARPSASQSGVTIKANLTPSRVVAYVERVRDAASEGEGVVASIAYPTSGLVLTELSNVSIEAAVRLARQLRGHAADAGGSVVMEGAPLDVKRQLDIWGEVGGAMVLTRRLKEQFDPQGTLSPGRYVGGL